MPFYLTPAEKSELKEVARTFFRNGHPESDPEIKNIWPKYQILLEAFVLMADAKHGNILNLLFSGGVLEQPYKTTNCILEIQGVYREYISEETQKALRKAKQKRR